MGSIYEHLLEQELAHDDDGIIVAPNISARKDSGSYYTPDNLVSLIIKETLDIKVSSILKTFATEASNLIDGQSSREKRLEQLKSFDPAERILDLKICDPAMGSGHFLVNLVDYLTDQVIDAIAEAENKLYDYVSPLVHRISAIRRKIETNAEKNDWAINSEQLDDRHIIRRMVLKRCVYGVDKNPMAVELAKVSLWLHTFTVGAPLSFLDHHLRCGNSLFGAWVHTSIKNMERQGGSFLSDKLIKQAASAARSMQTIEELTDAEIAEAHKSADVFSEVEKMTEPLNAFLSLNHAFDWMNLREREDEAAYRTYLIGGYGDPIDIAQGKYSSWKGKIYGKRFSCLLSKSQNLIADEKFFNWQTMFPNIWSNWDKPELAGGFDAVIGNPPWDRMKLQRVEWFAMRRPEIANAIKAADRDRMIANLEKTDDSLTKNFSIANKRAMAASRMAQACGDYPLLSGGDINLYSLFVERAMTLVKPNGMIGFLVPSGIASDKTAAKFFQKVSTEGRLKALYDFENKKKLFSAVDSRFKFCIFIASPSSIEQSARCAFYLHSIDELDDSQRYFMLKNEDFAHVNPNTGTAPHFSIPPGCRTNKGGL